MEAIVIEITQERLEYLLDELKKPAELRSPIIKEEIIGGRTNVDVVIVRAAFNK